MSSAEVASGELEGASSSPPPPPLGAETAGSQTRRPSVSQGQWRGGRGGRWGVGGKVKIACDWRSERTKEATGGENAERDGVRFVFLAACGRLQHNLGESEGGSRGSNSGD